jgi:hypothetical protein
MHPGQKFVFNMQISEYPAEVEVELLASLSFDDSPVITTPLVYGGGDPGRGAPGGRTRVRVMDHSGSSWITVD